MHAGTLIAAALIGVASFRLWRIIAKDQIAEPVRVWLLRREGRVWTWIQDLVTCPWCLGWWIAGTLAILMSIERWEPIETVIVWCVASAVTGLLGEVDQLLANKLEHLDS